MRSSTIRNELSSLNLMHISLNSGPEERRLILLHLLFSGLTHNLFVVAMLLNYQY